MTDLLKARIGGYTRRDGTYVKPHSRKGDAALPQAPAAPTHFHPRRGENGERVALKQPSQASSPSTWHSPAAVATFLPDGDTPASLNGIPMTRWRDAPLTDMGWEYADGVNDDLDEPAFHLPAGKKAGAGVVIEEPDGRVWIIHPTNQFGNYEATFPKGTAEPELSLQGNALKETWEELGFEVEITGFLGDFPRTTSVARMYSARRISGSPSSMGWESQAASLVPKSKLDDYLNMWSDKAVLQNIDGAKPSNKKEE